MTEVTDQEFTDHLTSVKVLGTQIVEFAADLLEANVEGNDNQNAVLGQIIADMAAAYVMTIPELAPHFAELLLGQIRGALGN